MRTMKSYLFILFGASIVLLSAALASAQQPAESRPSCPKFEIGLWAGLSGGRALGTTSYQDSWSSFLLSGVTEMTTIQARVKSGWALGGSFAYFPTRHFGFRILAGYVRADVPDSAKLDFGWTWSDGSHFQNAKTWAATGQLTSIPVSLDVAAKANFGRLDLEASGGPTYFRNTLNESSSFGYGVMRITYSYMAPDWVLVQTVDALPVGLTISDKTWYAWGANIGGSANLRISEGVGLRADVRYFYCPKKDLHWDFVLGTYDGIFSNDIKAEPFTDQDAAYLAENNQAFSLRANPSFVQVTVGLVLFLGRW